MDRLFVKLLELLSKLFAWMANTEKNREKARKKAEEEAHYQQTGLKAPKIQAKQGKTAGKNP